MYIFTSLLTKTKVMCEGASKKTFVLLMIMFPFCLRFDEESNKWNYLFVVGTISVCSDAFRQMLFGLCGAPGRAMECVLKGPCGH